LSSLCAVSAVLVLGASPALAAGPSPSPTSNPAVTAIDQQIASAKSSLSGWENWLEAWGGRIDQAQRQMQHARFEARALARNLLNEDLPRASAGSLLAARVAMRMSVQRLEEIETSRQALTGEQNVQAWENYLAYLIQQRRVLLSSPAFSAPIGGQVTYLQWAGLFLQQIGAPTCSDNLTIVVTWESQESTAAAFNPLATTVPADGAVTFNTAGVKNYTSLDQGLQATADTLRLGSPTYLYGPVLQDLEACAPASTTAVAINASSWCRGCADGGYATGLLPQVQANQDAFDQRLIATKTF
jgi:hypothetical protein